FKVNAIARLFQRLRHILCGTIVAEGAGGSVATTLRGDVLQRSQMPEGALACRCVEQVGSKSATDDVFRPGHAAWWDCSHERSREAMAPAGRKVLGRQNHGRPWGKASNERACIGKRCTTKNPAPRHRKMLRPPRAATPPPRRRAAR